MGISNPAKEPEPPTRDPGSSHTAEHSFSLQKLQQDVDEHDDDDDRHQDTDYLVHLFSLSGAIA